MTYSEIRTAFAFAGAADPDAMLDAIMGIEADYATEIPLPSSSKAPDWAVMAAQQLLYMADVDVYDGGVMGNE